MLLGFHICTVFARLGVVQSSLQVTLVNFGHLLDPCTPCPQCPSHPTWHRNCQVKWSYLAVWMLMVTAVKTMPGYSMLMKRNGEKSVISSWLKVAYRNLVTTWLQLCSEGKAVRRTWHTTCGVYSTGGYTELYTFGGSPDNIWQTGSRDLHGPAIFTCGIQVLVECW